MSRTLSEIYWETAPKPWWRRALDALPADRDERACAWFAVAYVAATVLMLAVTVRP